MGFEAFLLIGSTENADSLRSDHTTLHENSNLCESVGLKDCRRALFLSICNCQLLKYIYMFTLAAEAILLASRGFNWLASCCLNNLTLEFAGVVVVDEIWQKALLDVKGRCKMLRLLDIWMYGYWRNHSNVDQKQQQTLQVQRTISSLALVAGSANLPAHFHTEFLNNAAQPLRKLARSWQQSARGPAVT